MIYGFLGAILLPVAVFGILWYIDRRDKRASAIGDAERRAKREVDEAHRKALAAANKALAEHDRKAAERMPPDDRDRDGSLLGDVIDRLNSRRH